MVPFMHIVKHMNHILFIDIYICMEKKKWINEIHLNIRVQVVNRKSEKEFVFYLTMLVLFKIRSEVNMTKC